MGISDLIKDLEMQIADLKTEIQKREEIILKIQQLEKGDIKPKKRRGPGRPAGATAVVKRGRKPGAKPGRKPGPKAAPKTAAKTTRKPGRPPVAGRKKVVRKQYDMPVGQMILSVLKKMKQPVTVEELAERVHRKFPDLGGVKYKAIVSSMVSRDSSFHRHGKNMVSVKK